MGSRARCDTWTQLSRKILRENSMPTHKESSRAEYNYCYKSVSFRKLRLRSTNCGAILIEFAVCMPILIILLFYINDLVRIRRYYSQTEFVAQQFVNIIQNISQKRDSKKITKNDFRYAASLAFLSIYPGKTAYSITGKDNSHEFSHDGYVVIYYVKGLSGGKASFVWGRCFYQAESLTPSGCTINSNGANSAYTVIKGKTNVEPSAIYPTLKINEGEVKILVEVQLVNDPSRMNPNGPMPDTRTDRSRIAFGCRLIAPKTFFSANTIQGRYFPSVVIFTPKPGLFSETAPS